MYCAALDARQFVFFHYLCGTCPPDAKALISRCGFQASIDIDFPPAFPNTRHLCRNGMSFSGRKLAVCRRRFLARIPFGHLYRCLILKQDCFREQVGCFRAVLGTEGSSWMKQAHR